jgi:DNA-binding IclR family transcriptional regulator
MATHSTSKESRSKEARTEPRAADAPARAGAPSFPNRVKPVSNAIEIVRHLSRSRQPATVTQLARQLSINPSTCFNILRTLVWEGLIDFDEPSKSYTVGLGVVKLAGGALSEVERLASLRQNIHEIAERHGVTLLLWRRVGDDRMLLVLVENSSADLQIHLRAGQRLPLLLGATGRAVASHLGLTRQQLREKFRSLRWARRLSFEEYWRDVQVAAERGWAVDDGYFGTGATTVAAPVFDRAGRVSHSLVAIMFRGQHDQSAMKRIGNDLIQLSAALSAALS